MPSKEQGEQFRPPETGAAIVAGHAVDSIYTCHSGSVDILQGHGTTGENDGSGVIRQMSIGKPRKVEELAVLGKSIRL